MKDPTTNFGLYANPKAGSFEELPKPSEINYKNYE